ncbi:uncharacterized protein DS421_1g30640 [Arachis hypogaea]|nr:uncharacterized protein DS421_1g30640 [Arachis hypogaea]
MLNLIGMQMIMFIIFNWMVISFDLIYSCIINNNWMFNSLSMYMIILMLRFRR